MLYGSLLVVMVVLCFSTGIRLLFNKAHLLTKRMGNTVLIEMICCGCCKIISNRKGSFSVVLFHIGVQLRKDALQLIRTQRLYF